MTKKILILSNALLFSAIVVFAFSGFHSLSEISKGKLKSDTQQNDWLKDGDIVFQTTNSAQCEAVQLATKSPYSHCGIVFKKNGSWRVLEAVQPVRYRSFDLWIQQGVNGHYVVKRLKNAETLITPEVVKKM